jgi:hypothetical protein
VARQLGADRKPLHRWLRAGAAPSWPMSQRGSILDRHRAVLERRWPRAAITLPGCGGNWCAVALQGARRLSGLGPPRGAGPSPLHARALD